MPKYKVLAHFSDPEHRRVYYAGNTYPAPGCSATPERIDYLSGNKNKAGRPLIAPQEPATATTAPDAPADTAKPTRAQKASQEPAGKPKN